MPPKKMFFNYVLVKNYCETIKVSSKILVKNYSMDENSPEPPFDRKMRPSQSFQRTGFGLIGIVCSRLLEEFWWRAKIEI